MSERANQADPRPPSLDRLSLLWRRINDHKLVQWTVAYVALAYGIQHGVTLTSEAFEWPHVVERVSMLLLALGLPVVMTLAWYHGARASRRISGPELSIISILLVIGTGLFYVFARPSEQIAAGPAAAVKPQAASVAGAPVASAGISIAVLPFANVSGDTSQEFFSDGMTDEIISALINVSGLRVVARSSAFEFKGQNKEARAVGQALGASHLIEGSVRRAGNRVRITAQLVQADNGLNLWSANYDRELTDIFATQEDVAQAIAGALRVPLGLKQGDKLVRDRTKDLESYDQYLRAKVLLRARGTDVAQAITILEQVVARDSAFAPAWGLLAQAYVTQANFSPALRSGSVEDRRRLVQSMNTKAEMAAREAIRLDSRNAIAYGVLGRIQSRAGQFAAAEDLYKQALALDPAEPEVLYSFSLTLAITGRLKDALSVDQKLRTLEPSVPNYRVTFASHLVMNGQAKAAIPILESLPADAAGGLYRNIDLAQTYAAEGRYADAADALLAIPQPNVVSRQIVDNAARLLRTAPAKAGTPRALPDLDEMSFVYAYVGAEDRLMDYPARQEAAAWGTPFVWYPAYAPARKTERFKKYVRDAALVDYWKARGWPDLCHPVGADDFACN